MKNKNNNKICEISNLNRQLKIPNIALPEEDELYISWLHRLALLNGHKNLCHFLGRYVDKRYFTGIPIVDDRIQFSDFYRKLALKIPMYTLFDSVSLIKSYAPVYSPIKSLRILIEAFYRQYGYTFMAYSNNRAFEIIAPKICPVCWQEKQIIYKSHNLHGVNVCKTHGVPLMIYKMNKGTYSRSGNIFSYDKYTEIAVDNIENELEYARYSYEFAKAGFDFTKADLYRFLTKEHDYYERHPSRFWNEGYSFEMLIRFLMKNYPNISDFAMAIQKYTRSPPDESFYSKEGFTLMSPSLNNFVQLSCNKCGTEFITTSWAIENGFGCPYCDSKKDHKELTEKVVSKYSGGKYKLISYESANHITLEHCCGEIKTTSLSKFLSHQSLCKNCEARFTIGKTYSKRHKIQFDETKFELVGSKNEYIKIWSCRKCRRVFQYNPTQLRERNTCPLCAKDTEMHKKIDSQCFGKFEILKYPTVEDESVKLKCLNCGHEFDDVYRNESLRKIKKNDYICPACRNTYTITAARVKELIRNRYKLGQEFSISDFRNVTEIKRLSGYTINSKLHYLAKLGILKNTGIGRFTYIENSKSVEDK